MDSNQTEDIKRLDLEMSTALPLYFRSEATIRVDELDRQDQDRTLLWGYTIERDSFHVYLKDKLIHIVTYDDKDRILKAESGFEVPVQAVKPSKRAYPDGCDEQFCRLLIEKKQPISYTVFNERQAFQFHGALIEDLEHPL